MPIYQQGALNTTALVVPDLYVVLVPPQQLALNGIASNVIGISGTAQWGPVGRAVVVSSMADYAAQFGAIQARKYDLGTPVATAVLQGANAFRCVRVTDGTETAASGTLGTNWLTLTGFYAGSKGNGITATLTAGGQANSYRLIVGVPGRVSEVYDNVGAGLTGNALAVALAAAVNNGTNVLRSPSTLVIASAGVGTTAPAIGTTITLSGGTDGAGVTASQVVGQDTLPRKGIYALRNTGCAILVASDVDDSTLWTTIGAFAVAESMYAIQVMPSGGLDTLAAVTTKQTAGLDDPWTKLMLGDWVWWNDPVLGQIRLVSPQGFAAGRLGNLSPEQSSLNKPLYGIAGTQKSGQVSASQASSYSAADLAVIAQAGIDVIANPAPRGAVFAMRIGHNSSTDNTRSGDNFTRMTNYIATTLNVGMGGYVGQVIDVSLFRNVKATLVDFLSNMRGQGQLPSASNAFSVMCDLSNNPLSRTSLGYVQADCAVRYLAINEKFIVNLQGGTTVTTTQSQTTLAAA